MAERNPIKGEDRRIRYAVVGLGHIAQVAVLPAFAHASENSELVALVSSDPEKLKRLGERHGVATLASYDEYDSLLESGRVDAVYLALPNTLHRDFAVRAARRGVHVLCEKPMAVTSRECEAMIRSAEEANVRLMIAYRLHFEEGNLETAEVVASGTIGEPRIFNSTFTQQVREGDVRLRKDLGGGPVYDMGVYCINAARYLFRDEPLEVSALAASGDPRFDEVAETVAVTMRFPGEKLASFVCGFGAEQVNAYRIVGAKGVLRVEPAYTYGSAIRHELVTGGRRELREFPRRDQFAPEIVYFSRCVLEEDEPEPSGIEGMIDVRIVEAIHRSIEQRGRVETLDLEGRRRRPERSQGMQKPPVKPEALVNTAPPTR
ncbi:MAG: Gfo/Idh/MocA family oxidoreductase [Thermoanaerobaculia bacterium]